jgi:hypothetical protein
MEMYKTTDEAVDKMLDILEPFLGRIVMFHVGTEMVDELRDYTPFDVEDWGVYEDEAVKTLTIYNNDHEIVLTAYGNSDMDIFRIHIMRETIGNMIAGG